MNDIRDKQGRPVLKIRHLDPPQPQIEEWEHGFLWHGIRELVIELDDAHWYGQGGLVHQQYPLEKLAQYEAPFLTSDNGATGLLGMLEPFWFNSEGGGVLIEGDDLTTSFNKPLHGAPPPHSFTTPTPYHERPLLADGLETDQALTIRGDHLTVRLFACQNAREVVERFWERLTLPDPPPAYYFEKPLWTTWAHFKNDISHERIVDYVRQMQVHNFPIGMLGIDAKWQHAFGDSQFDLAKFPDPRQTVNVLHQAGIHVTLWCVPFYNTNSQYFQPAIDQHYIRRTPEDEPYIGDWWEGRAVFLDVTNPAAMQWHLDNLTALAEQYGIDGFKFDAGEGMFYAATGHGSVSPNHANHLYIKQLAARYPWSDVRSGWKNQADPMLFRQWDKGSGWGFDNGLASCITQAITLNLLGYPYSFPDMIGGNHYGTQRVSAELLIRWTQAVAPMPIIQFSIPPWEYGEACAQICARYAQLHAQWAAQAQEISGLIVCPLWWLDPQDEQALICADQYLIGDNLLVAPIIIEGARQRDIYLPRGKWASYWNPEELYQGGQWLRDYPAPLDTLPIFQRLAADA